MARKDKPPLAEREIETGCVCVFLIHVKAELVRQDCAEIAIKCHGFA